MCPIETHEPNGQTRGLRSYTAPPKNKVAFSDTVVFSEELFYRTGQTTRATGHTSGRTRSMTMSIAHFYSLLHSSPTLVGPQPTHSLGPPPPRNQTPLLRDQSCTSRVHLPLATCSCPPTFSRRSRSRSI